MISVMKTVGRLWEASVKSEINNLILVHSVWLVRRSFHFSPFILMESNVSVAAFRD